MKRSGEDKLTSNSRAQKTFLVISGLLTSWIEFRTLKFKGWLRVRMAWGRRRAGPGLPAPPLSVPDIYIPLHLQSNTDAIGSAPTIPVANNSERASLGTPEDQELYQVEVYGSKEESLEVVKRRMALREPIGPAFVTQAFSQLRPSTS